MEALQNRIRELVIPCLNSRLKDCAGVLGDRPVRMARDLWLAALSRSPKDAVVPADVVSTIAFLHWCRYQLMPEGGDRNDLQVAAGMFARLHATDPGKIPDDFHQLASTDEHRFVDDDDGVFALMPESYLSQNYPVDAPRISICADLPMDVTSDLNLDTSDPRTLWMLMQAYNLSVHITARCAAREIFSHIGQLRSSLRPASAFHLLSAVAGDREKSCIVQAVESGAQTLLSLVYTGEGEMGNDAAAWLQRFGVTSFAAAADAVEGQWEIGKLSAIEKLLPDMRVLPLAAFYV